MKRHLSLIVFAILTVIASAAFALDNIGDMHVNDASGVPVAPYARLDSVNVRGIITAEFTMSTVTFTRAFIQDHTGGINIFKSGTHICFNVGDDVSIGGHIDQFNGLTEIMISTYTIHSSGNPLPAPLQITVAELVSTFKPDYKEPNESRLIKIKGAQIVGTAYTGWPILGSRNYTINDSLNTGSSTRGLLFIYNGALCATHPLIGTTAPVGGFDVVGILSQFDTTSPYTGGYQIAPRGPGDIIQPPTEVIPASWGRVKAMYK